ncbi:uncharacterized protein [Epargyreus clarus]|uniref:uncharacterized protein n=1 Tax=Epargyreus clarus TaxID=520877 RepID=UPI003C3073A1
MEHNIINTLLDHHKVTSTYADIYFDDGYCKSKLPKSEESSTNEPEPYEEIDEEWISPSDLLIGKIELKPPFTSKITRGKTHEGILAIGNEVLEKEHRRFMASLTGLLHDNDESWNHILINEKKLITKRVKEIFQDIFKQKSKIMNEEIMIFYENTLRELESHLQAEVQNTLKSVHANMISSFNIEIPIKLKKERIILENVLKNKYKTEVDKIIKYYKLLLANELYKNNKLINVALNDRNDALQAYCRQIDAERLTSSMYIMSIERKKCVIKKMFLENYQSAELSEKLMKIKERQDIIEGFKQRERKVSDINKQWEEKMEKVLELFLKFISFSLKLLPEQSTFLLDFQKMVVLQLNEMQKHPNIQPNILIDEDTLANVIEFETSAPEKKECELEPFVLIGDLSDPVPPRYGSTETLPSDVDLPFIRVNREYIYAKCHGYEEIKKFLESQKCQCARQPSPTFPEQVPTPKVQLPPSSTPAESTSSTEPLLIDDILRLEECPARSCGHPQDLFPFLPSYIDFNEQNFQRVTAILGKTPPMDKAPELIRAKNIACSEIPFAETTEKYRHVETQYSTQEIDIKNISCTCVNEYKLEKNKSIDNVKETPSKLLTDALNKRKNSLRRLLDQHPNLLKVFTDESFDFQL